MPADRLRVLYITDSLDAPFRYRCENGCLQLRQERIIADVAAADHPDLLKILPNYSVIVLFRLAWSSRVEQIVELSRRQHSALVFDIDDLIFTENAVDGMTFLNGVDGLQRMSYRSLALRLQQTMRACRYFLGSTMQLVREAGREGRRAFLHPNLLHPETVQAARRIRYFQPWLRQRRTLSYLSGSNTHDRDLLSIAPAIAEVMREASDVLFLLGGFVELPGELACFEDRIVRLPFVDWRVLPWIQALSSCNLAPLAEQNEFSHSKSALKFFEAAIVGVPTAASPSSPMRQAIANGENGFLPETQDDWIQAMRRCLQEPERDRLSAKARRTAKERFCFESRRGALQGILRQMVDPRWKCAPETALDRLLHGLLRNVEGKTVDQLRGVASDRRKAIGRILVKASDPRRLDAGSSYRQPARSYCRVTMDGGAPKSPWQLDWNPANQLESIGRDQYAVVGDDPFLLSHECRIDSRHARYLALSMRFESTALASVAQIYWTSPHHPHFSEARSLRFPVLTDGAEHVYAVDLYEDESGAPTSWKSEGSITQVRFDPAGCPGKLWLRRLEFLPANALEEQALCA